MSSRIFLVNKVLYERAMHGEQAAALAHIETARRRRRQGRVTRAVLFTQVLQTCYTGRQGTYMLTVKDYHHFLFPSEGGGLRSSANLYPTHNNNNNNNKILTNPMD